MFNSGSSFRICPRGWGAQEGGSEEVGQVRKRNRGELGDARAGARAFREGGAGRLV